MSRLFDALQHSEFVRTGLVAEAAAATEVLEAAERQTHAVVEPSGTSVTIAPNRRLVTLTNPESLGAEKFRFLGVRLRALQQEAGLNRLLITSSMAEEGKSLVAANLAITLARRKRQ